MGNFFSSSRRADSISLQPAANSPTHSTASFEGDHSAGSSPDAAVSSPPGSPTVLTLPATADTAKTYLLDAPHPDSGSSSDDEHLEEGRFGTEEPQLKLSCCGLVRANVAAAYAGFAESKVGLVTRAFVMSLPQCLAIATSFMLASAGLFTSFIELIESDKHTQEYLYSITVSALVLMISTISYDFGLRLYSHVKNQEYTSFGVFRLRSLLMGAALGGSLMRDLMYKQINSSNPWLNFCLTVPFAGVPAYLRYRYFKHDIVPQQLGGNAFPNRNLQNETGFFDSRFGNALSSLCSGAASGAILFRAVQGVLLKQNYLDWSLAKVFCSAAPATVGVGISLFCRSPNSEVEYRWKQLNVLSSDTGMIFIGAVGLIFGLNWMHAPRYWSDNTSCLMFISSVVFAAMQASRVQKKSFPQAEVTYANSLSSR